MAALSQLPQKPVSLTVVFSGPWVLTSQFHSDVVTKIARERVLRFVVPTSHVVFFGSGKQLRWLGLLAKIVGKILRILLPKVGLPPAKRVFSLAVPPQTSAVLFDQSLYESHRLLRTVCDMATDQGIPVYSLDHAAVAPAFSSPKRSRQRPKNAHLWTHFSPVRNPLISRKQTVLEGVRTVKAPAPHLSNDWRTLLEKKGAFGEPAHSNFIVLFSHQLDSSQYISASETAKWNLARFIGEEAQRLLGAKLLVRLHPTERVPFKMRTRIQFTTLPPSLLLQRARCAFVFFTSLAAISVRMGVPTAEVVSIIETRRKEGVVTLSELGVGDVLQSRQGISHFLSRVAEQEHKSTGNGLEGLELWEEEKIGSPNEIISSLNQL